MDRKPAGIHRSESFNMNAMTKTPLHGEVLPPQAMVGVSAALHPLKSDHELVFVPAGSSITEIIDACSRQCSVSKLSDAAYVTINGHPVPKEIWHRVRVKETAQVVVRATAGKGMGGILKSILMIALVIVANIVAPGIGLALGLSPGLVSAGIVFGGGLLLNALFPPASTDTSEETKTVYSIAGTRNGIAKWGPIPVLLGTARIAPKYAASPYTEFVGDDQYLRMLFVWGQGPMDIGDIKIGETLLSEYDDVEIQTFNGYATDGQQTLYPAEVIQDDLSIELSNVDGPHKQTSAEDANEIIVDLIAPSGLFNVDQKSGKKGWYAVNGVIRLYTTGTSNLISEQGYQLSANSADPIRRSFRFVDIPVGQYDVVVSRDSPDDEGADDKARQVVWSALKTFRNSPPIEYGKPLAISALRIRATKQLNGAIDDLNAVCTSRATSWTGSSWEPNVPTQNPADLFRLVLQGPGCARPVPDSRIDLETLKIWSEMCTFKGWKFNMLRDFTSSVRETLRDVCAAGRAVPLFRDGKWSVAWEEDLAPVIQHFTPRNSSNFTWGQTYRKLPHGLRVKFVNERKGYIEDERLVFDDGFTKANATLYEQAEFPGVTDPDLIYKHGRYRIADAKLRPATYNLTTDFEHLVCTRGDRVRVAHDVIKRGLVQGRVKAVNGNVITLDDTVTTFAGSNYGVRFRHADMSSSISNVAVQNGGHDTVAISGRVPAVGDLFMFGLLGQETGTYRIMSIRPGEDLSAEIMLVDDAPGIQMADVGPIFGEPGVVAIPSPARDYYPRNLNVSSVLENRQGAAVYVTTLYWTVLPGPSYQRFEVVSLDPGGVERIDIVPGYSSSTEFLDLENGTWTWRMRAILEGGGATGYSPPFSALVGAADGSTGTGLVNVRDDIRDILEWTAQNFKDLNEIIDGLSASTALNSMVYRSEASRLNSKTFLIDSEVEEVGARVIRESIERQSADEVMAADVTRVEARLDDPETGLVGQAVALDALTSRVTITEEGIESVSTAFTGVKAQVDDPATGLSAQNTSLSQLSSTVTQQGTTLTAQGVALTSTQSQLSSLGGTVSGQSTSLSQLTSEVSQQGSTLTAQGSSLTATQSQLSGLSGTVSGQATALSQLNTTVSQQGTTINSTASQLIGVSARAGEATAEGLIRFLSMAGTAGATARIALIARASTGAGYQETGTYWDVMPDGTGRIFNLADRFIISDGINATQAFVYSGGVMRVNAAVLGTLIVERSIDTARLAINGVTFDEILEGAVSATVGAASNSDFALGITVKGGAVQVIASAPGGQGNTVSNMIIYRDGNAVASFSTPGGGFSPDNTTREGAAVVGFFIDYPSPGSHHTYTLLTTGSNFGPRNMSLVNLRK